MKKVIAIIFVFFLSFGLFSFVDNSIAWAEEITGGTNYENAPLLTEETTSVVVTVKQFWNDMGQEMYAPLGRIFKFKPSESGVYTITTAGIEDDTNTFCFTVDEEGEPYNKNIYYYDNIIKFNHKLEGLVAGETYYISIDARSRYSTNYTISFDRPLMSSSAESDDATLSGITVDNIAVPNFDSANTTYDLGLTTKSSIEINAITNDPNAAVSGDISAQDLSIGQNTFILTVTAEDGTTTKDYIINIIKGYNITYTAGEGGSITGDIIQSVAPGENGTEVTAVPETGYKFVKWSDGETKALRTDTNITSDINLTAEFAENGKVSEVTIDKPWDGSTLQASVEAKLSGNPVTDITTLNITAGELTDADVMWITNNLENLTILNIIGATIFTDETLPEYAFSKYNYGSVYTKLAKLEKVTIDIDDSKIIKFSNFAFVNCGKLTNVNLPNATEFGSYAFANCGTLTSINLPEATKFGNYAFRYSSSLTNVDLPKTTEFGGYAFAYCGALTSIDLPKITGFGIMSFDGCTKAISMTLGAKPPTINDFGSYIPEGNPIIIVPESAKGTYDEADSSNDDGHWYQWKIVTIDETHPTATEVTMESNNTDKTLAKVGDTITLNITASEAIQEPIVTIAHNTAVVSDASDDDASTWDATYKMQSGDTEGAISFTLDFKDLAGNSAEQITAATSGSTVTFDKTAPTVTNYSPVNGVTAVSIDSNLELTFAENIAEGIGNITIHKASSDSVAETVCADSSKVEISGVKAIINPENDLENGTEYYVQIENGSFIDEAGNAYVGISDKTTWNFTTGEQPDIQAPTVESFSPAKGATDVAINSNLEIIFGENIENGTGNIKIFRANDGSVTEIIYAASDKVSVMGSKATIDPESDLEYETEYYVQIENGSFIDEAGDACLGISDKTTWSFTTGAQPDTQVPTIESFSPVKGATDAAIGSNLEIIFGENIEKGTGNIKIFRANDGSVAEIIYAASDKVSVMGAKATINPEKDLANGTEYYVQIEKGSFIDEAGNAYLGISNKTTWSFKTISQNNSTGGSSNKGSSDSSNKENIKVKVNGQTQTGLGQAQTQIKNGQIVTIVKVNGQKLKQKLEQEGQGSTVTIPVQNQRGLVVGKLNGQMVKTMEENAAVLEISTDKAGYILPAKQIKIDQVSKALGQQVSLKDIIVEVEVGETPKEMVKVVENTASKDNFTLVVPPVDFTVKCTHRDQTIEVKGFSNYVARIIAIPDGVDHNKITTGLITYPDGTTCHVPTKIIQIEGVYYAKINSLTNSTYTVIWNPKNYQDVKEHWAQAVCNEMGARKVVEGTTEEMFSPDQQVTRLTFTQAIVRALGIGEKGTQCKFTDVDQNKPYFGAVATGCEYSLVGGYEDDTFRAFNNVTREEAAALLVRAMKIAGLKTDYTEIELQQELNRFVDEEEIGAWAREVVAICVKNDMIVGNERGEFMPQEKMTKAQLAAIMMRILEKAELI